MMAAGIAGIPDILSGLAGEIAALFRAELRLAQSELSDKIDGVALACIPAFIGAVIAIPALTALLFAGAWAMVEAGLSTGLSFLIVGVVAVVAAGILFGMTRARLKAINLAPRRTLRQIERDVELVKDQVNAS